MDEVTNPSQEALDLRNELDKKLHLLDGQIVAKKFTPDGEILIMRQDGKDVDLPMEWVEEALPSLKAEQHDAMGIILAAVNDISEKKRLVPLTRGEAIGFGIAKQTLRSLEGLNLVSQRVIALKDKTTLKSIGGRAIVYFTPKGRGYARKHFDAEYGVGGTDSSPQANN